jgi:putative ABC transport system permease protein
MITLDYFRTLSIPLVKGRDFTARDDAGAPGVIIVNEAFARKFFPNEDPLGKRIKPGISTDENDPVMREIVGVVGNVRHRSLSAAVEPEVYVPHAQIPLDSMSLVVKTGADARSLAGAVRNEVRALDKDLPVYNVKTLDDYLAMSVAQPRFNTLLLASFAALALVLTAVGLYGVMSYSVVQRTHEIGVRLALGAQSSDVLKLVVGQGMLLALIGTGLGLLASLAATRVLASLLYEVSAADPLIYAGITLLLTTVALLACYIPARRATKVDPMVALRYE